MMMMITLPCIVPITIKLYSLMLFSYICDQFEFLRLMVYLKLWTEIFQNPVGGQVRIKVQACGICHGDSITKQGLFQGIQYPRVPGHEVAGIINEVGKDGIGWKPGQRVAVGWYRGNRGHCEYVDAETFL